MLSALLSHIKTLVILLLTGGSTLLLFLNHLKNNKVQTLEVKLNKIDDATELAPIDQALQEAETNVAKDEDDINKFNTNNHIGS
jgi:hypothetical protein